MISHYVHVDLLSEKCRVCSFPATHRVQDCSPARANDFSIKASAERVAAYGADIPLPCDPPTPQAFLCCACFTLVFGDGTECSLPDIRPGTTDRVEALRRAVVINVDAKRRREQEKKSRGPGVHFDRGES